MDYLPHALRAWLEEAELQDSCRENLVITHSGDSTSTSTTSTSVIGFLSLYFLSSRSRAVKFAFRVHRQAAAPHQATSDSDAVQECAGAGLGAGRVLAAGRAPEATLPRHEERGHCKIYLYLPITAIYLYLSISISISTGA